MKRLLTLIFSWWSGETLGTRLFTWRKGIPVGTDAFGNRYFQERGGERRWVIYPKVSEASAVPPEWNGWLRHTAEAAPVAGVARAHAWQLPHLQNMTGTPGAYHPPGSLSSNKPARKVTGDYEAWTP